MKKGFNIPQFVVAKVCVACNQGYDRQFFRKHLGYKDALTPRCVYCLRKIEKAYRAKNSERINLSRRAYRKENREVCRIKQRLGQGKPERREVKRQYRWRKLDAHNAYGAKRRANKLNATPAWADLEAIKLVFSKAKSLEKETGIKYHVHHTVPLSSDLVCGLHCEANLVAITAEENMSIGNRYWPDMWD